MNPPRRRFIAAALALGVLLPAAAWWLRPDAPRYLPADTVAFVALFTPPPAPDSAATRRELDELLELQRLRSDTQVTAARADRKKDVSRFFGALGIDAREPPGLPRLTALMDQVESDIGPYVRAAKQRFLRLRPYEIEPRIETCIGDVRDDQSYPSGHAAYGYVTAYLLRDIVPEREIRLLARADEFARQRMVCGVHFSSDLEGGRVAATWLARMISANPDYRHDANAAMAELRATLGLPPKVPPPR